MQRRVSDGTMNKALRKPNPDSADIRSEYRLDYSRAKPNRFASRMDRRVVAVVLEPDVAAVFDSSKKVNAQLRASLSVKKARKHAVRARTSGRKAG